MPGYILCYFIEQGRGLNLSKIENVQVSEHLIYITAIIKHLWILGSLISINSAYYHKVSSFFSGFSLQLPFSIYVTLQINFPFGTAQLSGTSVL